MPPDEQSPRGSRAPTYVAFLGSRLLAEGDALTVGRAARHAMARATRRATRRQIGRVTGHAVATENREPLLVFDAVTSEPLELDLRGSEREVLARLAALARAGDAAADADPGPEDDDEPRGPGRPRLGVVGREVTLLPRHWRWLGAQPGGASAALRRLVDHARAASAGRDRRRRAQEYAYRFLVAMLGDAEGFEEAIRALFAGDRDRFMEISDPWPPGPRDHARRLAAPALTPAA